MTRISRGMRKWHLCRHSKEERNGGSGTERPLVCISLKLQDAKVRVRNSAVLHRMDLGIVGCYNYETELLAKQFGVDVTGLETPEVTDPYESVLVDISALRVDQGISEGVVVT